MHSVCCVLGLYSQLDDLSLLLPEWFRVKRQTGLLSLEQLCRRKNFGWDISSHHSAGVAKAVISQNSFFLHDIHDKIPILPKHALIKFLLILKGFTNVGWG